MSSLAQYYTLWPKAGPISKAQLEAILSSLVMSINPLLLYIYICLTKYNIYINKRWANWPNGLLKICTFQKLFLKNIFLYRTRENPLDGRAGRATQNKSLISLYLMNR